MKSTAKSHTEGATVITLKTYFAGLMPVVLGTKLVVSSMIMILVSVLIWHLEVELGPGNGNKCSRIPVQKKKLRQMKTVRLTRLSL